MPGSGKIVLSAFLVPRIRLLPSTAWQAWNSYRDVNYGERQAMNWNDTKSESATTYRVVVNDEQQYSIWPDYREVPSGWKHVGKSGPKAECLAYIKEVWTDMRPLSLRQSMEEFERNPPRPPAPRDPNAPREKSLVDKLCEGDHPVEVG